MNCNARTYELSTARVELDRQLQLLAVAGWSLVAISVTAVGVLLSLAASI
jgi:hypothetical protein